MPASPVALWAAAGYLCGSVPFAYLIVRLARGIDLREHGSGNIGATNAARVLGARAGIGIFALDVAKGCLPAAAALRGLASFPGGRWEALAAGAGAIVGHCFPVWLSFRGGKGVATGAGALAAIAPRETGCALLVWIAAASASRYVSLASVLAALSLVGWAFLFHDPLGVDRDLAGMLAGAAALVVWRHRRNLVRIARGQEPRLGRGAAGAGAVGRDA